MAQGKQLPQAQAVPAIELETALATAAEGNSDITGKGELWARK
jgi:hypothetical protein